MADQPDDMVWRKLGAEPGLCQACQYPKLNQTRRGTVYLRCGRAERDSTLPAGITIPLMGRWRCRLSC
jgi:hypothetical protein